MVGHQWRRKAKHRQHIFLCMLTLPKKIRKIAGLDIRSSVWEGLREMKDRDTQGPLRFESTAVHAPYPTPWTPQISPLEVAAHL